jgi:hypothetical protein
MGTNPDGEDSATSRGLLQRLLSPGSFRLAHRQGDDSTTSRRASGDDNDSIVEDDSAPGIQDNDEDENEDEDFDMEYSYWGRPFAKTPKWFPPVTAPQEAGLKLLMGGEFGRIGVDARSRSGSANFSRAILSSRSKLRQTPKQDITNVRAVLCLGFSVSLSQDIIPNTDGTAVASLTDNIYCGQYSAGSYAPSALHAQCLTRVL